MRFLIVDLEGSTHSGFDDATELLRELDLIWAECPDDIDELAVLKYGDDGERVGEPVPARSFAPTGPAGVGAVMAFSGPGVGSTYTAEGWHLDSATADVGAAA